MAFRHTPVRIRSLIGCVRLPQAAAMNGCLLAKYAMGKEKPGTA